MTQRRTIAERISTDIRDIVEAHTVASETAVTIETPHLAAEIFVFEDGSKLRFEARRMTIEGVGGGEQP
ncbi:hypothetical protein [Burkholderia vietnamiensis]|uniref:hypothetical protein n=1 Tax=Burkholderia vietnamiensis TaxID=60552 RepID=UPI0015937ABF|nr:hypothetical protein [Burkholderia vietnamiensis]MCA8270376.1 hypothetical protein [Burkholderia vietnamiensis]